MKTTNRWICWLRHIWWALRGGIGDGHIYEEKEVHHGVTVSLGNCVVCDKFSVTWGKRADYFAMEIKDSGRFVPKD